MDMKLGCNVANANIISGQAAFIYANQPASQYHIYLPWVIGLTTLQHSVLIDLQM